MTTLDPLFLFGSSSILQITRTTIKSWMGLKFCQIGPLAVMLADLELQEKISKTYNGRIVVTTTMTTVLSFLGGSSSFLHVIRTLIKALRMVLNFSQIPSPSIEVAALERLRN